MGQVYTKIFVGLILIVSSFSAATAHEFPCASILAHYQHLREKQNAWKNFDQFDVTSDQKQFLVHALKVKSNKNYLETAAFLTSPNPKNYLLSLSLVSNSKGPLAGDFGFVVRVDPRRIIAAHVADFGIVNDWTERAASMNANTLWKGFDDFKAEIFQKYNLPSPRELLENTTSKIHNEVVADLSVIAIPPIQIAGIFFVKKRADENPERELIRQRASDLANDLGLPLETINR